MVNGSNGNNLVPGERAKRPLKGSSISGDGVAPTIPIHGERVEAPDAGTVAQARDGAERRPAAFGRGKWPKGLHQRRGVGTGDLSEEKERAVMELAGVVLDEHGSVE